MDAACSESTEFRGCRGLIGAELMVNIGRNLTTQFSRDASLTTS